MKKVQNHYCFLTVGKTQESTETSEGGFKRYIGVGSSFVKAVNPKKKELEELMGYEIANEPEYVTEGENGKEVHIHFIVKTDPEQCGGVEITNRLMFTLRNAPAYNRDQSKVQVIDNYGNHTWMNTEDAKAGKVALLSDGNPNKIDTKYRIAGAGECDLVDFLKTFLCIPDAFNYVNGVWVKKENADTDCVFALECIKDYFNGNFSELNDALKMQPNNKVKLLYGVRTSEGKQYQAIASKGDLILPNSSGAKGYARLEKNLANAKQGGAYANTEFKVQELAEYVVEPTNLEKPAAASSSELPWD